MIDISHKRTSLRYARAVGSLHATSGTIERVRAGTVPKGDVGSVARSAGILAAKRASEWLVFCHSMPVDWVEVRMELEDERIVFTAEVRSVWKTGMEMEAMTAVSAALLNAYDMLKPIQEDLWIGDIRLEEKRGGKSDMTDRFPEHLRAAIVIVSTAKKEGKRADRAGDAIREFLSGQPVTVAEDVYVEQDAGRLAEVLKELSDGGGDRDRDGDGGAGRDAGRDRDRVGVSEGYSDRGGGNAVVGGREPVDLVFVCGATGPTPGDISAQVIREVSDKLIPGIGEAMRSYGYQRTPFAMLSEQVAGLRGGTLLLALPGSQRGAEESLNALFPGVLHLFRMLRGK